ncbi:MAG: hypothetical protein ACYDFU_02255 [Nitrospirota bacterium]
MLPANKRHFKKVALWGGGLSVIFAAASLLKFPPLAAVSILTGAVLSVFNIYSIISLVEALASAALSDKRVRKTAKILSVAVHMVKFLILLALLTVLVVYKLTNLLGLAFGFTVIVVVNIFAGLSGLKAGDGLDK